MVKSGQWTPVLQSEWATPLVPIIKSDGSVRLAGDYKVTVNPNLIIADHPLPDHNVIFSQLAESICMGKNERDSALFTKLDLRSAFMQLEMDENSKDVCTVTTHRGLYKVHRLPYGIASSPAIWQNLIDTVLNGLPGVVCFMDDILIAGSTEDIHNERLRSVLAALDIYNIKLRPDKCRFAVRTVHYLGFRIDGAGIHKTTKKIKAILNCAVPTDTTQLKSFLGLVTFYARFVPNLATMAQPLYALTKKGIPFQWGKGAEESFCKIKEELSSDRFLCHYDHKLPIKVACDASSVGIGAVLSHVYHDGTERPIEFASRTLKPAETNYSQIDKEALAIVYACQKWHYYLFGRAHFTLVTDHKPLLALFGEHKSLPKLAAARLQRWALLLSAYNYTLEYVTSKDHGKADALSRSPFVDSNQMSDPQEEETELSTLLVDLATFPVTAKELAEETKKDKVLSKVYYSVLRNKILPEDPEYKPYRRAKDQLNIETGMLLYEQRVVIPSSLQGRVLRELHSTHMGMSKTKALARSIVWWPNMDKNIEQMVSACLECQAHANDPAKITDHSWKYPDGPWKRVHVDFAGPFRGKTYLILVDAYSKWPEVFIMNTTTTTSTIRVLTSIFARQGLPLQLVSDNGPQFTSGEFRDFMNRHGIMHSRSAPFRPATNGLAERFVQTFKGFLKAKDPAPKDLEFAIWQFLLRYRITPHSITGLSPSELLNNRQLRSTFDLLRPDLSTEMRETQQKAKSTPRTFEAGTSVMFRVYNKPVKWSPGEITRVMGDLHYEVMDNNGDLHKKHIDQLKRYSHQTLQQTDTKCQDTGVCVEDLTLSPVRSPYLRRPPPPPPTDVPPPVRPPNTAPVQRRQPHGDGSPELVEGPLVEGPLQHLRRSVRNTFGIPPLRFSPSDYD